MENKFHSPKNLLALITSLATVILLVAPAFTPAALAARPTQIVITPSQSACDGLEGNPATMGQGCFNEFIWFGFNYFSTASVWDKAWSNCPTPDTTTADGPVDTTMTAAISAKNPECTNSPLAGGNPSGSWANWDYDAPFITPPPSPSCTPCASSLPFLYNGHNKITWGFFTSTSTSTYAGQVIFTSDAKTANVFKANPMQGNITQTDPSTGLITGWNLVGGSLAFRGTPSNSTFVSGTIYQWTYITPAYYSSTGGASTWTTAIFVPKFNAYFVLFQIYNIQNGPFTEAQIQSIDTGQLGTMPTSVTP